MRATDRAHRIGRWAFGILTFTVAHSVLPTVPFIIFAVVVALVTLSAFVAYWHEQAFRIECDNNDLVFSNIGLVDDLAAMTREYDAVLLRLSEVLDEHALCPRPDAVVVPIKATAKKTTRVPHQRGRKDGA